MCWQTIGSGLKKGRTHATHFSRNCLGQAETGKELATDTSRGLDLNRRLQGYKPLRATGLLYPASGRIIIEI